ncbi:histidine kinase [Clostridium sp. YIM B02565]|uniref:Histidine kinase n=2 Tax=Clostridium paridis TaxID=2803863 RepID=A0A937FGH7_9CLOT|nr:histidine kinase [Clostridium paridis]
MEYNYDIKTMNKKRILFTIIIVTQGLLIKFLPEYWLIIILLSCIIFTILTSSKFQVESREITLDTHFLFNAINTIIYYCRADANIARRLLLDLSGYLRYFLENRNITVKLKYELDVLDEYLSIQKARFQEKFDYSIEESDSEFIIFKNSIIDLCYFLLREGIIKSKGSGRIDIIDIIEKDHLLLEINYFGKFPQNIDEFSMNFHRKYGYEIKTTRNDNGVILRIVMAKNNLKE